METTTTTDGARAGLEVGYGLHNYTSTHEHWTYQAHNGGVNGGLTEFAYLPDAGRGYAFMINSGSGAAYGDISDLVRNYQTRDLDEPDIPEAAAPSEADLQLVGLYHPINSRQQLSYFLDRMFGATRFWFDDGELRRKPLLGGEKRDYVPAGDGRFLSPDTGRVVVVATEDPLAGPVLHVGTQVFKTVSPLVAYGQLAIGALWLISIVTSFVYFLVWGVRKWRGKVPAGPSTRIRVWPLLAGVSVTAFLVLFATGMSSTSNIFETLGKPTAISISIMLATLAFGVFAVLGAWTAARERGAEMNRFNYWYCSISSALHLLAAIYLGWFGIIGIQTWA
jgi:hypothetical protein